MEIKTLLGEEIKSELDALGTTEIGSDLHKQMADTIAKLADRAIKLEEIETDSADKEAERQQEHELKTKQLELDYELKKQQLELDYDFKVKQLEEQEKARVAETDSKSKQLKHDKHDGIVKHILTGLSIGVPVCLAVWGTKVSYAFEKDGIVPTTIIGRGFLNKLLPRN